ncbi:MAG: MGH1-like glycoside hydrolase domain-containing protein, partial [Candidatus Dormibacteraceae bacterium]
VDPREACFDPARYWRGPVWVNVNWLAIEGLARCGLAEEANGLGGATLAMLERSGMSEYFDARDGSPLGIGGFTWTAALTLDLLAGQL